MQSTAIPASIQYYWHCCYLIKWETIYKLPGLIKVKIFVHTVLYQSCPIHNLTKVSLIYKFYLVFVNPYEVNIHFTAVLKAKPAKLLSEPWCAYRLNHSYSIYSNLNRQGLQIYSTQTFTGMSTLTMHPPLTYKSDGSVCPFPCSKRSCYTHTLNLDSNFKWFVTLCRSAMDDISHLRHLQAFSISCSLRVTISILFQTRKCFIPDNSCKAIVVVSVLLS